MNEESGVWIPIAAYRDFYDVPRAFLVEPKPHLLLFFDCPFDEAMDDYPPSFQIYAIEGLNIGDLPENWKHLYSLSKKRVGQVPLTSLRFDSTRRREVLVDGLPRLIKALDEIPSVVV